MGLFPGCWVPSLPHLPPHQSCSTGRSALTSMLTKPTMWCTDGRDRGGTWACSTCETFRQLTPMPHLASSPAKGGEHGLQCPASPETLFTFRYLLGFDATSCTNTTYPPAFINQTLGPNPSTLCILKQRAYLTSLLPLAYESGTSCQPDWKAKRRCFLAGNSFLSRVKAVQVGVGSMVVNLMLLRSLTSRLWQLCCFCCYWNSLETEKPQPVPATSHTEHSSAEQEPQLCAINSSQEHRLAGAAATVTQCKPQSRLLSVTQPLSG